MSNITLDPSGSQEGNLVDSLDSTSHYEQLRYKRDLEEWLSMGVFAFRWPQVPAAAVKVRIRAVYRSVELETAVTANTVAYAAHSPADDNDQARNGSRHQDPAKTSDFFIQVRSVHCMQNSMIYYILQ